MALVGQLCRVVLYEGPGAEPLENPERLQLISALLEKGFPVTRSGGDRPGAPVDSTPVMALARFTEQPPTDDQQLHWRSLNGDAANEAVEKIAALRSEMGVPQTGGWKPWFPVIDYDRCT